MKLPKLRQAGGLKCVISSNYGGHAMGDYIDTTSLFYDDFSNYHSYRHGDMQMMYCNQNTYLHNVLFPVFIGSIQEMEEVFVVTGARDHLQV
ncbi:hypothetical protein ANAPH1_01007 [Anaplasma phagocytophilum]|nr:hypothetical protein ANAPH1_01007 [Anaplasma phagocytophilum]